MKIVKLISMLAAFMLLTIGAFSQDAGAAVAPAATVAPAAEKPAKPARKPAPVMDVSTMKAVTAKGTVKLVVVDAAKNPRLAKSLDFQLTGDAVTDVIAGQKDYIENTLGLKLTDGVAAEVAGWEKKMAKRVVVIAQTITVDGKVYILRDEFGEAAWQAKKIEQLTKEEITKAEIVTVNGTAKLPETVTTVASAFVRFAIDEKTVVLIAPKKVADALGIDVKEGDKLSATGWKIARGEKIFVLARDLTVNDKVFTLRDADGKIIRTAAPKGGNKPPRVPKVKGDIAPK